MANHKSAEKRARQTLKRNSTNRARRSRIHTAVKAVEDAVVAKNADTAMTSQRKAESVLAKSVNKGTLHWKTAARKASRLAKRVKSLKKA